MGKAEHVFLRKHQLVVPLRFRTLPQQPFHIELPVPPDGTK